MQKIGFDVAGHSKYNDKVWETLNEIAKEYQLIDVCLSVGNFYGNPKILRQGDPFDYWMLLPTMLASGAVIAGEEESDGLRPSYSVYIRNDDTVEEFCERMKKVKQFY